MRQLRSYNGYNTKSKKCNLNICQSSFFYDTVKHWNTLPATIVQARSIEEFKHSVLKFYKLTDHDTCNVLQAFMNF